MSFRYLRTPLKRRDGTLFQEAIRKARLTAFLQFLAPRPAALALLRNTRKTGRVVVQCETAAESSCTSWWRGTAPFALLDERVQPRWHGLLYRFPVPVFDVGFFSGIASVEFFQRKLAFFDGGHCWVYYRACGAWRDGFDRRRSRSALADAPAARLLPHTRGRRASLQFGHVGSGEVYGFDSLVCGDLGVCRGCWVVSVMRAIDV
jgi:hypothetical protein